jgi:hypothetical protein
MIVNVKTSPANLTADSIVSNLHAAVVPAVI